MITMRMNFGEELNKEINKLSTAEQKEFIVNNIDSLEIVYSCEDEFYILSREDVKGTLEDLYKENDPEIYSFFQDEENLDGFMSNLSRRFGIEHDDYIKHHIDDYYYNLNDNN